MITSIKTELKTWLHTGRACLMFIFILGMFIAYAYTSISYVESGMQGFAFFEEHMTSEEMLDELARPLYYEGKQNAILMYKQRIEILLYSLSPRNAIVFCEEVGLYVFPVIIGAFGALTIYRDRTSNIMRPRVAREGKWRYFLSKQIVMIGTSFISTAIATAVYKVASAYFFKKAQGFVTSDHIDITVESIKDSGNMLHRTLFFLLCMIIYLEINFCLAFIFKTPIVPITVTGYLWYINLYRIKMDPQNAVYNIANRFFDFMALPPNKIAFVIPLPLAVIIVSLMLILPLFVTIILWKKRSAY